MVINIHSHPLFCFTDGYEDKDTEPSETPSPSEVSPLDRDCTRSRTSPTGAPPLPTITDPPPQITDAGLVKEDHPNQPYGFDGGQNLLQTMENDAYNDERLENPFYPFKSQGEWQLARWLSESRLTQAQIDKFLKLHEV